MNWRRLFFGPMVYQPVVLLKAGRLGPAQRFLARSQFWSRDRLEDLQLSRLRTLLARIGVDAPPPRTLDDLRALPFTTKADIQQRPASNGGGHGLRRPIVKTTGGSTGQPVTVLKSPRAWLWELAATWRGYDWAGVRIGDPQARFWGVPLSSGGRNAARLTDWICHRQRFSAFAFTESDLDRYVAQLRRFRPRYFYGYVSMIEALADHVARRHPDLDLGLRCIITTSEVLTDDARSRIAESFRTRVFNEYGCGELGTIAHECPHGNLHLSEENMIVEFCRGDRPCAPGEVGELVVTELNNDAGPLIRYRTGDLGACTDRICPCGRPLTVLTGLHGRAYDMIVNSKGTRFHGEFMMYVFEELKRGGDAIRQFQVRQLEPDRFRVLLVPGADYGPDTDALITARVREHIDPGAHVDIETVDRIERSRSGKMRLIIGLEAS